jgi:hypothetical protein
MCGTAAHTSFVHFETQPGYLDTGITLSEGGIGSPATGDRFNRQEIIRLDARRERFSLVHDSYLATLLTIPSILIVATHRHSI